jgi:hypothetical protein
MGHLEGNFMPVLYKGRKVRGQTLTPQLIAQFITDFQYDNSKPQTIHLGWNFHSLFYMKRPSTVCKNQNSTEQYTSCSNIVNLHKTFLVPHTHKNVRDIEERRHGWSVWSNTTNPPHILSLTFCNTALIGVLQFDSVFM